MNTKVKELKFQIVNGPSLKTLEDSFNCYINYKIKIPMHFEIKVEHPLLRSQSGSSYIPVKIKEEVVTALASRLYTSENLVYVHGYCQADLEIFRYQYAPQWKLFKFQCNAYNYRKRTGEIIFTPLPGLI